MASLAAIAVGATANVIGSEVSHLVDTGTHYVEEKVHDFIEFCLEDVEIKTISYIPYRIMH